MVFPRKRTPCPVNCHLRNHGRHGVNTVVFLMLGIKITRQQFSSNFCPNTRIYPGSCCHDVLTSCVMLATWPDPQRVNSDRLFGLPSVWFQYQLKLCMQTPTAALEPYSKSAITKVMQYCTALPSSTRCFLQAAEKQSFTTRWTWPTMEHHFHKEGYIMKPKKGFWLGSLQIKLMQFLHQLSIMVCKCHLNCMKQIENTQKKRQSKNNFSGHGGIQYPYSFSTEIGADFCWNRSSRKYNDITTCTGGIPGEKHVHTRPKSLTYTCSSTCEVCQYSYCKISISIIDN